MDWASLGPVGMGIAPALVAPLIMAGGSILSKFLGGFFGNKSKKKQAEALRKAQAEALAARKKGWEASEKNRGTRLGIAQDVLTSGAPGLAPGAPTYSIDPTKLAQLQAPRPFTDTMPADPRAGLGSELAAGMFGQAGDILQQYLLGLLSKQGLKAGDGSITSFDPSTFQPWYGGGPQLPGAFNPQPMYPVGGQPLATGSGYTYGLMNEGED